MVKAIERNRGEIDVAPLPMRAGAAFAGLAPETAAAISRKLGGDEIADAMAKGQADKR